MNTHQEGEMSFSSSQPSVGRAPIITVITAIYNADTLLPDTVRAIRAQAYPNIEWIVIDGGSTDGTLDILKANEDIIDYCVSESDLGMYDALAKGFDKAKGEILCWLNAGDIFMFGALSLVSELFEKYPHVNWITGMASSHLPGGKIVGCSLPVMYSQNLIRCGVYGEVLPFIQQESTFFRRDLLASVDLERFRRFKLAGDLYLWYCFAAQNRLMVVSGGLGSFCIHEGQLSENLALYRQEARTFLEPITLLAWIKAKLQRLLQYFPLRLKKAVAGKNLLLWKKAQGWY